MMTGLLLAVWFLPAAAAADPQPAKGTLLVAAETVSGELFNRTVILLIHYDSTGAMGLVINRPTDFETEDFLDDLDSVGSYRGPLYWGGPVQMNMVHALVHTDTPLPTAQPIFDSVYYLHTNEDLRQAPADAAGLRLFIGYAGWAAGQLDHEMARGSWYVVQASAETVFAEDPRTLWNRLAQPREYRASLE